MKIAACLLLLLAGCAGTMTIVLPNGSRVVSTKDVSFDDLTYAASKDGVTVRITGYKGNSTAPINAQTAQIGFIAGEAAKGAVQGMKP